MNFLSNRFRLHHLFVVVASAMVSLSAWAVEPFKLKDIRVEGLQRVESGTVFASLPFRIGDLYNDESGAAAIRALFGLGLFKDVRLETQGDVLVVIVEERPSISQIEWLGLKEFDKDVLVKAFSRLDSWRGQAPFEHWLMRMATRACLDALRSQRRQREDSLSDLSVEENEWLDRHAASPDRGDHHAEAARSLVRKVFEQLSPAHRLVLTLLELEDRSVKEISKITGWSQTLVKVRAFRARAEMKRVLSRLQTDTFL